MAIRIEMVGLRVLFDIVLFISCMLIAGYIRSLSSKKFITSVALITLGTSLAINLITIFQRHELNTTLLSNFITIIGGFILPNLLIPYITVTLTSSKK